MASFILLIGIGLAGAVGALARYVLGRSIDERVNSILPWGTLLINVSGAFVIGILSALSTRNHLPAYVTLIFSTGFLGGYTTFSTMSWEGVQLTRAGGLRESSFYLGGTVVLGLLATASGLGLGWLI